MEFWTNILHTVGIKSEEDFSQFDIKQLMIDVVLAVHSIHEIVLGSSLGAAVSCLPQLAVGSKIKCKRQTH